MTTNTAPTHDPEAPFLVRTQDERAALEYAIEALYFAYLPLINRAQSEEEKAILASPEGLRKRYALARMGLLAMLEKIHAQEWE